MITKQVQSAVRDVGAAQLPFAADEEHCVRDILRRTTSHEELHVERVHLSQDRLELHQTPHAVRFLLLLPFLCSSRRSQLVGHPVQRLVAVDRADEKVVGKKLRQSLRCVRIEVIA